MGILKVILQFFHYLILVVFAFLLRDVLIQHDNQQNLIGLPSCGHKNDQRLFNFISITWRSQISRKTCQKTSSLSSFKS